MIPSSNKKYIPPKTSNWNLLAPRTSREALGYQWEAPLDAPPRTKARTAVGLLIIAAVVIVYLGVYG